MRSHQKISRTGGKGLFVPFTSKRPVIQFPTDLTVQCSSAQILRKVPEIFRDQDENVIVIDCFHKKPDLSEELRMKTELVRCLYEQCSAG